MPGLTVGVYEGNQVAGTEVSSGYEGRHLTVLESELIHPFRISTFVNGGDPVLLCRTGVAATYGAAVGVAFRTATAATDHIAIDTEGIWNLTVIAVDDAGNSAVEIGDPIFIHDGSAVAALGTGLGDAELSKIRNTTTQRFFGYALGRIAVGAPGSGVIAVKVHFDDINDHYLEDQVQHYGALGEITCIYTGEEICYTDGRTIDDTDGYWRTLHVAGSIVFTDATTPRYASISCYTEINGETGGTGTSAFGGSFSLVHGPIKAVTGFMGAVMAEVKNECDNPDTMCAIFLRWDNDAAGACQGVMHSFIRCEDNSSATHITNLFELYLMDATAAAANNVIVCQAGNAVTHSHVIKITANGVPYWIQMSDVAPV